MSYDPESGVDWENYPIPMDDDGDDIVHRGIIEVIDTDAYIEGLYDNQGMYWSVDAATWCADVQTWEGESGHTFYLKDFMPCEENCPCEGKCEF